MMSSDELDRIAARHILDALEDVPDGPDRVRLLAKFATFAVLAMAQAYGAPVALQMADMLAAEVRKRGH